MKQRVCVVIIGLTLAAMLPGCTSAWFSRGVYESIQRKECMDRAAGGDCESKLKGYDEYRMEREGR